MHKWCKEGLSYAKLAKIAKCSKSAVFKIIKKFGEECTVADLPKSRRRSGPADPSIDEKGVKLLTCGRCYSVREISRKLRVSVGTVQNIKKRNNIKTYKKQKSPKRSADQRVRAKKRSGKLYKQLLQGKNRCILMDDETYVKFDTNTLPGPQYYNARKGEKVPDEIRTVPIEKFGEKVLVWQAICTCGKKSMAFFTKGTISGELYREQCIKRRLVRLYRQHDTPPLFWPDLASAHYAGVTIELLDSLNIEFVRKYDNPPNCPQLRPIERYWAIVKRHLRKDGGQATNMDMFKKMWTKASRKVTANGVQNLMKRVKAKVRQFYRDAKID